jgi:two-component sensor histidine kinase
VRRENTPQGASVRRDELAQLADEFNQLTDRLQTTEEARRRFVSDASHELKTPLASIRLLSASILQSEEMDHETTREFVAEIGEEADRLTRISEKLLTLTRLDAGFSAKNEPVELGQVVEKVCHMLRPLTAALEVTIEAALDRGCIVGANDDDLYQVAFNLIENAIKYNLPGGRVFVTLYRHEAQVILLVEDTGVGIPEEDLPRVFDRFYRVDKARSRAREAPGGAVHCTRYRTPARRRGQRLSAAAGRHLFYRCLSALAGEWGGDALMNRRLLIFSLLPLLLLSACGDAKADGEGNQTYVVYYATASPHNDGVSVAGETRTLSGTADPVEELMALLLGAPTSAGLTASVPEGVFLKEWSLSEGVLHVARPRGMEGCRGSI